MLDVHKREGSSVYHEMPELIKDQFFAWVNRFDTSDEEAEYATLQDYIGAWMDHGDGMEFCAGDFGNFAIGFAFIVAAYTEKPELLGHHDKQKSKPRRVEGLMDLTRDSSLYLNRFSWDQKVFKLLRGR